VEQYRRGLAEQWADGPTGTGPQQLPREAEKRGRSKPPFRRKSSREIETTHREPVDRRLWYFEGVETKLAARPPVFALGRARRVGTTGLNTDTSDHVGTATALAPAGGSRPVSWAVTKKRPFEKRNWGLCTCSGAYYHCEQCEGAGFLPARPGSLGLESFSLTPGVSAHDRQRSSTAEFRRKAAGLLHELGGGRKVSAKQGRTSRREALGGRDRRRDETPASRKRWAK